MLGIIKGIGCGLVDWNRRCLGGFFRLVAFM